MENCVPVNPQFKIACSISPSPTRNMLYCSTLLVGLLCIGLCQAVPTKQLEPVATENQLDSKKSPVSEKKVEAGDMSSKETKTKSAPLEIPSPLINPPTIAISEDEPTFGAVSGFGEGHFENQEYGYAGKGVAAGIAGAIHNEKGVTGGGAGHAAGIAGVDTVPFQGYVSVNTHQQATFNTYGEKAHPFSHDHEEEEVKSAPVPTPAKAAETKPLTGEKAPTLPLVNVAQTVGTLFRPLTGNPFSPPALFNTLTGGIFEAPKDVVASGVGDKATNPQRDESAEAESPSAESEESGGVVEGFYSFIRPITPIGIVESVSTILRPLTSVSGQAQGSITLTGGASYTGTPPKPPHHPQHPPPVHKPPPVHHEDKPPPVHHEHKPPPVHEEHKPTCPNAPHHDNEKLEECKALCHKKGKGGGDLHGGCCTCLCPAPEVPPGHLCCTGTNEACDAHCKHNSFHKYAAGGFCKAHVCTCRCTPWEPCWAATQPARLQD